MILVSATSGDQRITLLMNVIFFSGEEYNKLKENKKLLFLEEISNQTIGKTPYNIPFLCIFS